jgi:hypothetical protein
MGLVHVDLEVSRDGGRAQTVRFLVDGGAAYSVLPQRVWRALGLKPKRRLEFTLATGRPSAAACRSADSSTRGSTRPAR